MNTKSIEILEALEKRAEECLTCSSISDLTSACMCENYISPAEILDLVRGLLSEQRSPNLEFDYTEVSNVAE